MKINRQQLFELYMKRVSEISEECDWKTHFTPEEIVGLICDILDKNSNLIIKNISNVIEQKEEVNKDSYNLDLCPECNERAWDNYICHNCGLKKI